jgi:8-oxo-dGTP pyrophosphatase MutT (NUDIX family)
VADRIEQAGAIVFRTDGGVRVLLVRSRKDPALWIFPKGHIEPEESKEEAALREAEEEAGVIGEIIERLSPALEFRSGKEDVRVRYYLVRLEMEVPAHEEREKQWLEPADALLTISYDNARDLLRKAIDRIRKFPSDEL